MWCSVTTPVATEIELVGGPENGTRMMISGFTPVIRVPMQNTNFMASDDAILMMPVIEYRYEGPSWLLDPDGVSDGPKIYKFARMT